MTAPSISPGGHEEERVHEEGRQAHGDRTDAYKQVVLPDTHPLREFLEVEIVGASEIDLMGRPLSAPQAVRLLGATVK
ncbi:MAG: hypothetical protein HY557_01535 [Euryarchaeota archaeon]|nr:hypothetical protein [Euryarchaeota archaeon]